MAVFRSDPRARRESGQVPVPVLQHPERVDVPEHGSRAVAAECQAALDAAMGEVLARCGCQDPVVFGHGYPMRGW